MPEISRFYGIVIKMIFKDNEKHHHMFMHIMENMKHPYHLMVKC